MGGAHVRKAAGHRTPPSLTWHILVADEDPVSREMVEAILAEAGYQVSMAQDGEESWEFLQVNPMDLVLSDLFMPRRDRRALLQALEALPDPPALILVTAFASLDSAVEATKLGAYGYLTKPLSADRLLPLVGRALEERYLHRENRRLQRELAGRLGLEQIVGQSPQIREIVGLVEEVASSEASILILGKSGTGKELVARPILHGLSRRRERPFVEVRMAGYASLNKLTDPMVIATNDTLREVSELDGHAGPPEVVCLRW